MQIFNKEIADFKNELLAMASHAESALVRSVKALLERDDDLAEQVDFDDSILNHFEIRIDELAIRLLSQEAPLAKDLKTHCCGDEDFNDLERVGDEASKISRRTIELNREPALKEYVDIPAMAEQAITMLRESLDAFVSGDTDLARRVIPKDVQVNDLNLQNPPRIGRPIAENPSNISRSLNLMVVAKSLERVADHAKNIAEEVVFVYEGLDIRHGRLGSHEHKAS